MTPQQLMAYQMMMGGAGQGAGQSQPWMQGQPWMQSPGIGANPQLMNMLLANRLGGGQLNPQQLALMAMLRGQTGQAAMNPGMGQSGMNPQLMALLFNRFGVNPGMGQGQMTGGFQ